MNSAYKIQLFALVNTIISIFGIWYTQSFYWLMIGLISFAFVMIFSVNIAMHRFISHRSFTTGKIRTKLLKYLTVISAFGSPLSWAPMHRYHHVHSGTDKDNQAPENIGYIKAWLTLYDPIKIPTSLIKDIVRDKDCIFIANNYWKLLFSYVIILYLINPLIGIFVFS